MNWRVLVSACGVALLALMVQRAGNEEKRQERAVVKSRDRHVRSTETRCRRDNKITSCGEVRVPAYRVDVYDLVLEGSGEHVMSQRREYEEPVFNPGDSVLVSISETGFPFFKTKVVTSMNAL